MKIIWSPLAVQRMTEIADYIALDNKSAAVKWANNIFRKIEHLPDFPLLGRIVPETNRKEIREILFKGYRIIYRIEKENISILTIRHGRQLLNAEDIKTLK